LENYLAEIDPARKNEFSTFSEFRLLLEIYKQNGVDFSIKTGNKSTPLLLLTEHYYSFNYVEKVNDLLAYNVNITDANIFKDTPLLVAARKGWTQVKPIQPKVIR